MKKGNCAAHCGCGSSNHLDRRHFIRNSSLAAAGTILLDGCNLFRKKQAVLVNPIKACGPASRYVPLLKAAFVRRKEEYGVRWPGAVYDGEAALKMYTEKITETAKNLGVRFELRSIPLYTLEEADTWLAEAKSTGTDGLMLILLDRQNPAWPTAEKFVKIGIPSIIFSPLGTSFTTYNTEPLAYHPNSVIYSSNDFSQAEFGMKMLQAGTRMHHTKCIVMKGNERTEQVLADTGIKLQYLPA